MLFSFINNNTKTVCISKFANTISNHKPRFHANTIFCHFWKVDQIFIFIILQMFRHLLLFPFLLLAFSYFVSFVLPSCPFLSFPFHIVFNSSFPGISLLAYTYIVTFLISSPLFHSGLPIYCSFLINYFSYYYYSFPFIFLITFPSYLSLSLLSLPFPPPISHSSFSFFSFLISFSPLISLVSNHYKGHH